MRNLEDKKRYHREYMQKWIKGQVGQHDRKSRRIWRLNHYKTPIGNKKALDRVRRYRSTIKAKDRIRVQVNERRRTDPSFRLRHYLGARIWYVLKANQKQGNTMSLLGCSLEDFWIYLESKFKSGMTRDNYGKVWHIDHIMPCAIFDLSKPEHQKRCFHFSNLQPLFADENRRKNAKILSDQFNLL